MSPHVLLAGPAEPFAELGLTQEPDRAVGAFLGRVDEEPGLAVLDLEGNASDVAADEGARLPQRLRHGETEALACGLLDHDLGL